MKKIALFLTAVLCLTLCLMILASAEGNTEEPAPESEGFRYRLLEDGTAEIQAYTGKELALVLPETLDGCPVTSIGNEAFYNYRYSMEDNPFGYCTSLKTITVAEGNPVFYMEDGVLFCRDDHSLVCFPNLLADPYEDGDEDDYEPVTYKVPAGTEIIRGGAFGGVECLSEILLPDSLRVIGSQAFGFCWSLDSLIIPDSVTEIGDAAFDTCKYLSRVVLPAGLKRIPPMLFYECESLYEADIPESVTEIGDSAFSFCSSLEKVRIPDSVQSIGEYAFESCSKDLVVLCGPDSCAKSYCEQNGIEFLVK